MDQCIPLFPKVEVPYPLWVCKVTGAEVESCSKQLHGTAEMPQLSAVAFISKDDAFMFRCMRPLLCFS